MRGCTIQQLLMESTRREPETAWFFFSNGCTHGMWMFPVRDWIWAIAVTCTRSFNPLCLAGNQTCASAVTQAATVGFSNYCTMVGTPAWFKKKKKCRIQSWEKWAGSLLGRDNSWLGLNGWMDFLWIHGKRRDGILRWGAWFLKQSCGEWMLIVILLWLRHSAGHFLLDLV